MHFNTFKALLEVVAHHGDSIANNDALINLEITKVHPKLYVDTFQADDIIVFDSTSHDKALAIAFLKRCNRDRYRVLIDGLENSYSIDITQDGVQILQCYDSTEPNGVEDPLSLKTGVIVREYT